MVFKIGILSEYIQKRMGVSELLKELIILIKQYNQLRKTFLVVYAGSIGVNGHNIPDASLHMDDYYILHDMLRNTKSEKLDFYIETPGGKGEAAEEIARFLHSKFSNVSFVISGEAKSAGTLVALSGHDVFMTESGSLGPIDAQVPIGRSYVSAYDYMEWVNEKIEYAGKNGKLNPFDATMVAQISPGELKGVNNSLKFAEDLVVEWLSNYKFKNWARTETRKKPVTEEMKRARAKEIAEQLSNHARWRSHGRSIKIKDLEDLGLQVTRIDDNKTLANIVYRIQMVIKVLFSSSTTYKIYATEYDRITKQASPIGTPPTASPRYVESAKINIKCPKCGNEYKLFASFVKNSRTNEELSSKKLIKFPKSSILVCPNCNTEINLIGVKNDLEAKFRKKIVF